MDKVSKSLETIINEKVSPLIKTSITSAAAHGFYY